MRAFILLLTLINISFASGHSGRTNSVGCHKDKKNHSYQCHKIKEIGMSTPKNDVSFTTVYDKKTGHTGLMPIMIAGKHELEY